MNTFEFALQDAVQLTLSAEQGIVIGRAEYDHTPPQYYVRYVAADGRQVEAWFDGGALEAR